MDSVADNADAAGRHRVLEVLQLGGSLDHSGGLESFCERSRQALERRGGIRIERIRTNSAFLSLRRAPAFLRGIASLIAHRRRRPDCVWLQYANLPDLGFLLVATTLGMRVMVTPHLGTSWRSQASPFLRWIGGRLLPLASRLALISRTQELELDLPASVPRSLIRNFLPREVLAGPLGDPAAMPAAMQLIHSGRLSEGKGTFLLIEVCAALRDAGVPFFARITGSADVATLDRLHRAIAGHRLADKVAVLGRVPEGDLLDHLRGSDVLVHLSREDSYPLIVLEAMACSCIPLCLDLAGARDMVETYDGHVVGRADTVREAAEWLAAQNLPQLRQRQLAAAAQVRTDYDWDRCAAALGTALEACVAGDRLAATAHGSRA